MTPCWAESINLQIFILIILLTTKPQCSRSGHSFHGVQKDRRNIRIRSESDGSVMISPDMVNEICAMHKGYQKMYRHLSEYFQTSLHNKHQVFLFLEQLLMLLRLAFHLHLTNNAAV